MSFVRDEGGSSPLPSPLPSPPPPSFPSPLPSSPPLSSSPAPPPAEEVQPAQATDPNPGRVSLRSGRGSGLSMHKLSISQAREEIPSIPTVPAPRARAKPQLKRSGLTEADRTELYNSSRALVTNLSGKFERRLRAATAPDRVLCGLKRNSWLRRLPIRIVSSDWFDALSTVIILVNAIILCLYQPLQPADSQLNSVVDNSALIFTVIFTVEMLVKILALGIYGKGSYLADTWNWLDAVVVVLGYAAIDPSVGNISSIRLVRLLRSMTIFPGMRVILNAIVNSIPRLADVCFLACLFIGVFAMIGLTLWNGVMSGTCAYFDPAAGAWLFPDVAIPCALPCSTFPGACTPTFGAACPVSYGFALNGTNPSLYAPVQLVCLRGQNPDWGQTNFDNIASSALTSFTMITTEGWTGIMYNLWSTWGYAWLVSLLCTFFVLVGSLFILELSLAVVWDQYTQAMEQEKSKTSKMYRLLLDLHNGAAGPNVAGSVRKLVAGGRGRSSLRAAARASTIDELSIALVQLAKTMQPSKGVRGKPSGSKRDLLHGGSARNIHTTVEPPGSDTAAADPVTRLLTDATSALDTRRTPRSTRNLRSKRFFEDPAENRGVPESPAYPTSRCQPTCIARCRRPCKYFPSAVCCNNRIAAARSASSSLFNSIVSAISRSWKMLPPTPACLARPCQALVQVKLFELFFAFLIFANATLLGAEYEGMSEGLHRAFQLANYAMVLLFVVEFCVRMLAVGPTAYLGNRINALDTLVVLLSVVDAALDVAGELGVPGVQGTGLSSIRLVRIFRLLRLMRSLKGLRAVLHDLARAIPAAANAVVLLVIFMLAAAVMGMQLFGGTYTSAVATGKLDAVPRFNFNNLWLAVVTVFQVIDNENWDTTLHAHMASSGPASALFFVAVILVGNYLFLNVMIALLISHFEEASKVSLANMASGRTSSLTLAELKRNSAVAIQTGFSVARRACVCCCCVGKAPQITPSALPAAGGSARPIPPPPMRLVLVSGPVPQLVVSPSSSKQNSPFVASPHAPDGKESTHEKHVVASFGEKNEVQPTRFGRGGSFLSSPRRETQVQPGHLPVQSIGDMSESLRQRSARDLPPPHTGIKQRISSSQPEIVKVGADALGSSASQDGRNSDNESSTSLTAGTLASRIPSRSITEQKCSPRFNSAPSLPPSNAAGSPRESASRVASLPIVRSPSMTESIQTTENARLRTESDGRVPSPTDTMFSKGSTPRKTATQSPIGGITHNPLGASGTSIYLKTRKQGHISHISAVVPVAGSGRASFGHSTPQLTEKVNGPLRIEINRHGQVKVVALEDDPKDGFANSARRPVAQSRGATDTADSPRLLPVNSRNELLRRGQRSQRATKLPEKHGRISAWIARALGDEDSSEDERTHDRKRSLGRGSSFAIRSSRLFSSLHRPSTTRGNNPHDSRSRASSRASMMAAARPPPITLVLDTDSARSIPAGAVIDEPTHPCCSLARVADASWAVWCSVRTACVYMVTAKWFDWLVMLAIFVSTVNLALDHPSFGDCASQTSWDQRDCSNLNAYLRTADILITALFSLELVLQVIARGIWGNRHAYLADNWRLLDAFVVAVSIASVFSQLGEVKALRSLRALRALRPLRVISRFPSLRLVINALFEALPRVKDVGIVLFLVAYVFAVVGLQNFRGRFYACNDPSVTSESDCIGMFNVTGDNCRFLPTAELEMQCRVSVAGAMFPRVWASSPSNFDNIFNSLLAVFELTTGENWPVLALQGMDAGDYHQVLGSNWQPSAAVFYLMAQVVMNMFLVELFVGVIVQTYHASRERAQGETLLSEPQKLWVENMRLILNARPQRRLKPPRSRCVGWANLREAVFGLVTHPRFDGIVTLAVILNAVGICLQHYGQGDSWMDAQEYLNLIFTLLFALEALLRSLGLGWRQYFRSYSNRFDLLLVAGSFLSLVFSTGGIGNMFRMFRIARLLRLVHVFPGLKRLLRTLVFSLPVFANILAVLLLDFFIFSVIGMNLFAGIRFTPGGYLNGDANFDSFAMSLMLLIRASTGENFNGIMYDLTVSAPYCSTDDSVNNCGVSLTLSAIYWISFYFLTSFVLMNLLVAVVLAAFEQSTEDTSTDLGIYRLTHSVAHHYASLWASLDVSHTYVLPLNSVKEIIAQLPAPLGANTGPSGEANSKHYPTTTGKMVPLIHWVEAERILHALPLVPDEQGTVHFHSVLQALVDHASAIPPLGKPSTSIHLIGHVKSPVAAVPINHIAAARRLQIAWRARSRLKGKQRPRTRSAESEDPVESLFKSNVLSPSGIAVGTDSDAPQPSVGLEGIRCASTGRHPARGIALSTVTPPRRTWNQSQPLARSIPRLPLQKLQGAAEVVQSPSS